METAAPINRSTSGSGENTDNGKNAKDNNNNNNNNNNKASNNESNNVATNKSTVKKTAAASNTVTPKKKATSKTSHADNHEVLSDAVAASGVNIRAEEEAMATALSISKKHIEQNTFLKPEQLSWFIHKTLDKQGIKPVNVDNDVKNLISASCENYMSKIITDTIIMMRHRRHLSDSQFVNKNGKSKKSSKNSKSALQNFASANNKSEISKALRDIASKHKEREEKRIRRRVFLGLEEEKPVEEIVQDHNQTNLTANMMMSGSKQKKYSWMQSSSASNSNSINSLGDNGIRYREAREEPSVVMRDLIAALENRRMGVSDVLLKAYARLKD